MGPAGDLLLPRARWASRGAVLGALALSAIPVARGPRAREAVTLAALALGMPHGAADTELLRVCARGSRGRHAGLLAGYAGLALLATAVIERSDRRARPLLLIMSAVHFAEGEDACWASDPSPAGHLLRRVGAMVTSVGLPALRVADGSADTSGAFPASAAPAPRATARSSPVVAAGTAAAALVAAMWARGDRAAAADTALLTALDLLAPPPLAFAAYFGGWHALRHTARLDDELVASGQLAPRRGLSAAVVDLARRSAWAAGVGVAGAGALAVHASRTGRSPSRQALAGVLGLTVPHLLTVAAILPTRPRGQPNSPTATDTHRYAPPRRRSTGSCTGWLRPPARSPLGQAAPRGR